MKICWKTWETNIKNLEQILAILKFEFPSNHHYVLSDFTKNQ